ncbi:MAG TPA: ergothioneine biosynthesis protein EgtB [Allosphingosinicella sp.]|jgi:ergothioneine biosynthesis protein EgtB
MATNNRAGEAQDPAGRYRGVRALSLAIAAPLSDADATIQPMPDASPAKWHLAHTSWFFETFVLRDHVAGYSPFDARWSYLFNSYYEGEGERHARDRRGMLSRPSLDEILAWRAHVDGALAAALPELPAPARALVELGLHHEQQHQELMLMDVLAVFAANPLLPALFEPGPCAAQGEARPMGWIQGREGIVQVGDQGAGFAFDNERPRHRIFLQGHALGDRVVTNGEWMRFIEAGAYAEPRLWLADGWAWVRKEAIDAPLYWQQREGEWHRFGLDGVLPLDPAAPVCHISYYEADAFARWSGARLPTEAEWEAAASAHDPLGGNQLDQAGAPRPAAAQPAAAGFFGDVWEWTGSAYLPYPGFAADEGTIGEYNGKFMCSQMVLRGGSCATPRGHVRASYRNFFYPHQRWMFSGVRLARNA